MARKQDYDEDEVLRILAKKADINIDKNMKVVQVLREGKGDVGNGSWGKIDFLVNYRGWKSMRVNDFGKNDKRRLQKTKVGSN